MSARPLDEEITRLFMEYDHIDCFTNTLYVVQQEGRRGVFNVETRQLIVPVEYDGIYPLTDTLYVVQQEGRRGVFNVETREITWK